MTKNDRPTPEFVGHFGIDMKDDPRTDAPHRRGDVPTSRSRDVIVVSVNAKVDINWHLAATADAALPGISTDFRLTWDWGDRRRGQPPAPRRANTDRR